MLITSLESLSNNVKLVDTISSMYALNNLLAQKNIRMARVTTEADIRDVTKLRLKIYESNLPYMISQLSENGQDDYDHRSYIFAAWHENKIAASIRLTPYPFESLTFLPQEKLEMFLGIEWQSDYLEWSRLMVDGSLKVKGLMQQLIIFAGIYTLQHTTYTRYFGYSRPIVRRLFAGFQLAKEKLGFNIPERGEHAYELLKGSFIQDYMQVREEL